MTDEHRPSNDDLSAYLDGELPAGRRREMEASLLRDAKARVQVDAYRRQDDLLRLGLSLKVRPQADHWLRDASAKEHSRAGWSTRRAAITWAAVFGVAVVAGGWWLERRWSRRHLLVEFTQQAMLAHLFYQRSTLRMSPPPDDVDAQLRNRLGAPIDVPELSRFGLRLIDVRQTGIGSGRGILLSYRGQDEAGGISCFFERVAEDGETPFETTAMAGLNAVSRIVDGIGYAVVGRRPLPDLQEIATAGLPYGS